MNETGEPNFKNPLFTNKLKWVNPFTYWAFILILMTWIDTVEYVASLYRCTNLVVTLSHHNFVAKLIPSGAYWIQSTTNCTLVLVRNCALVHFISFPRNSIVRLKTKGGGKGGDKVSAMSFPAPRGNGEWLKIHIAVPCHSFIQYRTAAAANSHLNCVKHTRRP